MTSTSSLSSVHSLLKKYQLFPQKKWGQNFLVDGNIRNKIIDSCELNPEEYVVEIGPGLGALTGELANRCKGVMTIDIDTKLQPPLQEILAKYDNVRLLFADVLETNIEEELKNAFEVDAVPAYKICANIPYNITTPIIFHILEKCPQVQSATIMLQKEVGSRILASPGNKEYGLLTIMIAYYADVAFLMKVSRNCFFPRPDVDSSVIQIKPLKDKRVQVKNEALFMQLTRGAFQKRRKTMLNICASIFSQEKSRIEEQLTGLGIMPASRPENLTIEQFAALSDAFASQGG